jgi:hypothetical protein
LLTDGVLFVQEKKKRGEDPALDALMDELAKETGDPLFWNVSAEKRAKPDVMPTAAPTSPPDEIYGQETK